MNNIWVVLYDLKSGLSGDPVLNPNGPSRLWTLADIARVIPFSFPDQPHLVFKAFCNHRTVIGGAHGLSSFAFAREAATMSALQTAKM